MMNIYTVAECKALLEQNNIDQPKAKYSNNILLAMLDQLDDSATVKVEPTRGGFELNRGSLAEAIVHIMLGELGHKTYQRKSDIKKGNELVRQFGLNKRLCYEVKFATTFAPASASAPKTKYVILITADGAYLIETKNHEGRYTNNAIWDGERLDELSEALGL